MSYLLVTRPNHDPTTNYLYYWSENVIGLAREKDFNILDLEGDKATKENFESYISKNKPVLIFFNGHGNHTTIAGYLDEPLVTLNSNVEYLDGTIVYARSCQVGKTLGKHIVEKGNCKVFIGYIEDFIFVRNRNYSTKPLEDELAKLFLEPSNLVPNSLIKGNTIEEAYRKSQNAMTRNIRYMLSSQASDDMRDSASFLWSNRKSQVYYGDGDHSL